jgi:hypothetical protein
VNRDAPRPSQLPSHASLNVSLVARTTARERSPLVRIARLDRAEMCPIQIWRGIDNMRHVQVRMDVNEARENNAAVTLDSGLDRPCRRNLLDSSMNDFEIAGYEIIRIPAQLCAD